MNKNILAWPAIPVLVFSLIACSFSEVLIPVTGGTQEAQVIEATLCWRGPGPSYETVSALQPDTTVDLLGRGSIDGWLIVRNPIYNDPCWVEASALQMAADVDASTLEVFFPPPTPTPTFTPSPTSTMTPQPTSTASSTPAP